MRTNSAWQQEQEPPAKGISMATVRLGLCICLSRGLSPAQAARAVRNKLGVDVCERVIRRWRDAGMPIIPIDITGGDSI